MENKLLAEELETYNKHKVELLKENAGKYVLIKGKQVISVSDTQNDAIRVGIDKFGNTPFLVKKIEEIESRQNFTSNLIRVKQHAVGNC